MELIITGFGPFGRIENNPSSIAARMVVELLKSKYKVRFAEIQTAIQDVDNFYAKLEKGNIFVIHIGLSEYINKPQIETIAGNQMNFSIPDMRGNQPRKEKINKEMKYGQILNQCFDFSKILPRDIDINYSFAASSYICNYAFFTALSNVGIKICGTTFIHIPGTLSYPIEKSVQTVSAVATKIIENQDLFYKEIQ